MEPWRYFVSALLALILIGTPPASGCLFNNSATWEGLSALYRATNGDSWYSKQHWLQPGTTVCDWFGVAGQGSVLSLSRNNLVGSIPRELGNVVQLTDLILDDNKISGSLPESFGNLVSLVVFIASVNRLTGSLPAAAASWTRIDYVDVSFNQLTGSLPEAYGASWENISVIDVSRNQLDGTIPTTFERWRRVAVFKAEVNQLTGELPAVLGGKWKESIQQFLVTDNRLTGTLPPEYGQWALLQAFSVGSNPYLTKTAPLPAAWRGLRSLRNFSIAACNLSATLPPEWGDMVSLRNVQLGGNHLYGPLPSTYFNWSQLESFLADGNDFSGTVPEAYASWTSLQQFEVGGSTNLRLPLAPAFGSGWQRIKAFQMSSSATLSGGASLPPELSQWRDIERFAVEGCGIVGTLPPEYGNWSSIKEFVVTRNPLTGTLPPSYGRWGASVHTFHAAWTQLTGSIPIEYSSWSNLTWLHLANSLFSGSIVSEFGVGWISMQKLSLLNNSFNGTLPTSIATWRQMQAFDVTLNRFSGTLPSEIGDGWKNSTLQFLLSDNYFHGSIPASYGNLQRLNVFSIGNNRLSGTIPVEFSAARLLTRFEINTNDFTGTLPPEFGWEWRRIEVFNAYNNRLNGSLPASYSRWTSLQQLSVAVNQLSNTLPKEYGAWSMLLIFSASYNQLSGTLPPEYAQMASLLVMTLENNQLSGPIPTRWGTRVGQFPMWPFALLLHDNPKLGTPNTTTATIVPQVMFLSVCNTSFCGDLPAKWNGVTFSCQDTLALYRESSPSIELIGSLISVRDKVSRCTRHTAPPSAVVKRYRRVRTPPGTTTRVMSGIATGALVSQSVSSSVLAAGGSALKSMMQLSSHASTFARAIQDCSMAATDSGVAEDTDPHLVMSLAVGELIADNPLRLQLRSSLGYTGGTVLGNATLLVVIPLSVLLVVAVVNEWSSHRQQRDEDVPARVSVVRTASVVLRALFLRGMSLDDVLGTLVSSCLSVWSALNVPTIAAAIVIIMYLSSEPSTAAVDGSDFTGEAVVVVVFGVVCVLLPTVVVDATYCRYWPPLGTVLRRPRDQTLSGSPRQYLWHRCSRWKALRSAPRRPATATCGETAWYVMSSCARHCLEVAIQACRVPHSWVLICDVSTPVLIGVLTGVAAAPQTDCATLEVAVWCLVAVASAATVLGVVIRPRPTVAECLMDLIMSVWTLVAVVLAAMAETEASDVVATAQAVFVLFVSVPLVAMKSWEALCWLKRLIAERRQKRLEHEHGSGTRAYVRRLKDDHQIQQRADSLLGAAPLPTWQQQHQTLRELVEMICSQGRKN